MTETISQLITITGARGTGKTTLAATYCPPSKLSKVAYFDAEKSANNFRSQLRENKLGDFGYYVDLQETHFGKGIPSDDDLLDRLNRGDVPWVTKKQRSALIGYYQNLLGAFVGLPKNTYTTLVLDTAEKFEAGMAAYVEVNKEKFGITFTAYGKLWTEGVFPLYEALLQALWGRGIETVILTFHLKNVWEGSRPVPGKVAMSGKKVLYRLSSLMLWLVNDSRNTNGAPAGLVLKERQGHVGATNDEWEIRRMLPPRIPTCTWKEMRWYLKEGYNNSNPKLLELRSPAEEEMISPLLTDAQAALMMSDARLQEQENTLALGQMGLLTTSDSKSIDLSVEIGREVGGDTTSATNVDNEVTNLPRTKAEAIAAWRKLGKPIPLLLRKLQGVSEDEISGRWERIIGGDAE